THVYTLSLHAALPIYPGGAYGGHRRGDHGHHDTDQQPGEHVGGGEYQGSVHVRGEQSTAVAHPQRSDPDPDHHSQDGGDQAEQERLGQHRAEHLATPGTHTAQQGQFTLALGDEDREGVVDDDPRDEDGDGREKQQPA